MSRRRTFHVDWDSPSHETGTVKRRPASFSTPISAPNNCFENVEYYEVKNCTGGYGLKFLRSFVVLTVEDSGNGSEHPEIRMIPREEDTRSKNDVCEKCDDSSCKSRSLLLRSCGATSNDRTGDRGRGGSVESDSRNHRRDRDKHSIVLTPGLENCIDAESSMRSSKVNVRKNFGLKLSREPFQWRSKASRMMKISGSLRKLDATKTRSLIPKLKTKKFDQNGGSIANSSSESSGIGSPLSPLSPLNDTSSNAKDASRSLIKKSGSKSSGFESPDSPLSPESQKYTAFYLIEEQLEKLRNCPCQKRQNQVNFERIIGIFSIISLCNAK
ncbi:hypothetical protein WH47_07684 [Habropoda laboriosa]|uniref:Uncharacterized protein n=1 Tax=Habropoda laboriosa TaxID=597456 RepID=A0A0L7QPZ1_9HYME|nr:hypothetical protein WH47_07684 [Habropoda laboriosa]